MNADQREALLQELLEYVHGCHEDPAAIERRLEGDADLRELLAEAREQAGLLKRAAHAPAPALVLEPPNTEPGNCRQTSRSDLDSPPTEPRVIRRQRGFADGSVGGESRSLREVCRQLPGSVLVAAAVFALALLVPGGWWGLQEMHVRAVQASSLRLVVSGPAAVPDGAPARLHVETWDLTGEPRPARVRWVGFDEEGGQLVAGEGECDGAFDIELAANLGGLRRVEVTAARDGAERTSTFEISPEEATPLAHLSTDKPAYRPGEVVWLRAVFLRRLSLAPFEGHCRLRIVDPKGAAVERWLPSLEDGVASLAWLVPPDAAGGEYALELRDASDEFTVERLPLLVRRYQPPRLAKTITLDRETYAPGERGAAEVEVERVEGGIPAGASVRGALVVDGVEVWDAEGVLDSAGRAVFSFTVPDAVERGDARFLARVVDGGVVETAIEPFVVPTGELAATFYPEGGDLVAGQPGRVYAEVTDPLGRPASAKGRIVDGRGRTVTEFATLHQGRARFEFTPDAGERYRLEFEEPEASAIDLPATVARGTTLRAAGDAIAAGAPVRVAVDTDGDGPWIAGVFCRGVLVAQDAFRGDGTHELSLSLPETIAGVLRVTVFDRELRPVAERLVHRASGRAITVEVKPAEQVLLPGAHQVLDVVARDETGKPVVCALGVSVTDRAVRDMVGDARVGLADQTWLVADVEELEDLEEFFTADDEARRNVDLLLGTRGWRRFAWLDPQALVEERGDEAKRLLAREGRAQIPSVLDERGDSEVLLANARRGAHRARERFAIAGILVAAGLGLWGLFALLSMLLRSALAARPVLRPLTAGVMTAATVLLGLVALQATLPQTRFQGADAMAPAFMNEMIDAEEPPPAAVAMADGEIYLDAELMANLAAFGYGGAGGGGAPPHDRLELGAAAGAGGREGVAANWGRDPQDEGIAADFPLEMAELDFPPAGRVPQEQNAFFQGPAPELKELGKAGFLMGRRGQAYGRVYAHRNERASGAPRVDFTETAYWNALLHTSPDGTARVEFDLSDRVTSWNVVVDAHGMGRVGQALSSFEAVTPFRLEAKLPVELTQGDAILLPIAITSGSTSIETAWVSAQVAGPLRVVGDLPSAQEVALVDGRGRLLLPFEVTGVGDGARIGLAGQAGGWTDRTARALRVVSRGFPQHVARSGVVGGEGTEFELAIPDEFAEGSLMVELKLYPSPLANLLDGLDGILRTPSGCFEQASSSNYPNVLALAYLEAAGADEPAAMARARGLMVPGYAKIAGYECSQKGYEWFGGDPGHEALTAYGLLEFHDMAQVFDGVDDEMVGRTRAWLLDRRDGEGGYQRNARALDSFGRAPQQITDAYCTYALVVTGDEPAELGPELARTAERAVESEDPYEVALAAATLQAAEMLEEADAARDRLKTMQDEDGGLVSTTTSITHSGGTDLAVETTSLAILAWLEDPDDAVHVSRAVEFLCANRSGGGTFGATQATIQALRALTEYARVNRRIANAGEVTVLVNDYPVETIAFLAGHQGVLSFDGLADHLTPGVNRVRLAVTGGNEFPWACDVRYHAETPADAPEATVAIETSLSADEVEEGGTIALPVRVTNLTDVGQPMTLAVVGLPAGLEVPTEVLEDLEEAERFDLWEIRGREVVLYWRDLAPEEEREVTLDLLARIPGTTTGPSSRAYLYYTPEEKRWSEPLTVRVVPLD